jgi:hypothetical protein
MEKKSLLNVNFHVEFNFSRIYVKINENFLIIQWDLNVGSRLKWDMRNNMVLRAWFGIEFELFLSILSEKYTYIGWEEIDV